MTAAPATEEPTPLSALQLNELQRELLWRVMVLAQTPLAIWAGLGSGKTAALAILAHAVAYARPGARILVGMDTAAKMINVTVPTFLAVFSRDAVWRPADRRFLFLNGSVVILRQYAIASTQTEADNPWEGIDAHLVLVDEAQQLPSSVLKHASDRARQPVKDVSGVVRDACIVINGRPAANDWWPAACEAAGGHTLRATSYVNRRNLGAGWFDRQRAVRTAAEYKALIEGGIMPTEGAIYAEWSERSWPEGNILDGWTYDPERSTIAAIDFGLGWPSVVFFQAHDVVDDRGRALTLDVMFGELHPQQCLTSGLIEHVHEHAWPRHHPNHRPDGVLWTLDAAAVDPAGLQTSPQTGESEIGILRRAPTAVLGKHAGYLGGGLGVPVHYTTDADKRLVRPGIGRVQRLIRTADGTRRLVMSRQMYERAKAAGPGARSVAKALVQYTWDSAGRPKKGGKTQADHPVDAVRYYVVWARWTLSDGRIYRRPTLVPTSPVARHLGAR